MKRSGFLLASAVLLLALACGGGPEAEPPPPAGAPEASPEAEARRPPRQEAVPGFSGLSWETRTLERTESGCEQGACGSVSLVYPEFTAAPTREAKRALNRFVREIVLAPAVGEKPAATPEALAEEVLQEAAQFRREVPEAPGGWALDRTMKVVHHSPRVVSLEAAEYVFLGGAHPNSAVTYASFDPVTGRRLTLEDVILPGMEARLREIAEKRFREAREIPPERDLGEEGFEFEGGAFALNDNFAVLESGLVFYYNPYEIAAYVMGPTEVKLSREDLAEIVQPDGPLGD